MGAHRRKRVAGIIAEDWRFGESVHLRVQRTLGFARSRGLIARAPMAAHEAMFFERCRSVHGAFMRRPLVVLFLDDQLRITSVKRLRPWRIAVDLGARHTLEIEEATARALAGKAVVENFFALRGASFTRPDP